MSAPARHIEPPKSLKPAVARIIEALARAQVRREDRQLRLQATEQSDPAEQ